MPITKYSSKPLLILLLFLTIGACTSQLSVSVLKPSSIRLPASIKRISVFPSPGVDINYVDYIKYIVLHDSADVNQIRMGYLDGIYDVMVQSPLFDRVIFSDTSYRKILDHDTLYWDELREICNHDSTDVILILQKATCTDRNLFYEYTDVGSYNGAYQITNHTKWSFVQPFSETTLATILCSDTVIIYGIFGVYGEPEYLLYTGCYKSGMASGRKMVPFWKDTMRTYFTGPGRDLKDAARFAENNRWYNATRIWEEVVESGRKQQASRAAFNIAMAFEREDDLEQASAWLTYADSLHSTKHSVEYLKILENRLRIKPELERQFAGR